jgi:RNA polymerase sigma factor (sigma-70 family)
MGHDVLVRPFLRYRDHGDAAALASVFDAVAPDLLRLALHWTRRLPDAEDAVAETFLTAMTNAARFDATRPLTPWLVGILAHQARRIRDARSRMPTIDAPVDTPIGPSPLETAALGEWTELTREAVARLGPRDRVVLEPILFGNASIGDVARRLDAQAGSIRVRLHRGLARLRRLLPARSAALGLAPGVAHVRDTVLREALTRGLLSPTATAAWSSGAGVSSGAGGWFMAHAMQWTVAIAVVVGCGIAQWLRTAETPREIAQPATARAPDEPAIDSLEPVDRASLSAAAGAVPDRAELPNVAALDVGGVRTMGRVRAADDGAPIEGAVVILDLGDARETTRSDADGRFTLTSSAWHAAATVCARADGFADAVRAVNDDPALPVELELQRATLVRGRVVGRDGALEAYARVELLTDSRHTCDRPLAQADARGAFTLDRVDARLTPMARAISADAERSGFAIVTAEIAAGQPFTIVVDRGADVLVRVVDAERGTPIAGASVVCGTHDLIDPPPPRKIALDALSYGAARTTNADGIARFERVPLLGVQLIALAPGHALNGTFVVQRRAEGEVELELALAREGVLEGVVVDADDAPVPGARVDVKWAPLELRSTQWTTLLRGHAALPSEFSFATSCDARGRFRLGNLEAAQHVWMVAEDPATGARGEARFPLASGETRSDLRVRLERPATLVIRAFATDGSRIPTARIGAIAADAFGDLRVPTRAGWAQGFLVTAPGFAPRRVARRAELQDGMTFDVVLERAHTLRGRVVDERGEPAANVIIDASWSDGVGEQQVTEFVPGGTTRDGDFTLTGLPARPVHLALRSPEHVDLEFDVDVGTRSNDALALTMRRRAPPAPTARIEGTLVDAATRALRSDARAILVRAGALPTSSAELESYSTVAGRFVFSQVTPGTYRVLATADGAASALSAPLTVGPGGTVSGIELALPAGTTWSGTLRDETSRPCANVALRLTRIVTREDEPALVRGARTGADGSITWRHLLPGRYRVECLTPREAGAPPWHLSASPAHGEAPGDAILIGGAAEATLDVAAP